MDAVIILKKCPKCEIEKELCEDNFAKDRSRKSGFYHTCKECVKKYHNVRNASPEGKARSKAYYAKIRQDEDRVEKKREYGRSEIRKQRQREAYKNPESKKKFKGRMLKRIYGITIEEFENMLKLQNNTCKICPTKHLDNNKSLHVDHDHETGEIRGLLCDKCNRGLGYFKDNADFLESAIKYLNDYNGRSTHRKV